MHRVIRNLIEAALDFEDRYGRSSGILGPVTEEQVIEALDLDPAPEQSPGYDAVDRRQGRRVRIEIKGSRNPRAHALTSRFGASSPDIVVLGVLGSDYRLVEAYEAPWSEVQSHLTPKRQIRVRKFVEIGRVVWKAD